MTAGSEVIQFVEHEPQAAVRPRSDLFATRAGLSSGDEADTGGYAFRPWTTRPSANGRHPSRGPT
jgi:hypothetical protein